MKFIDLCAGIGGLRLAFEKMGHECVLTCEIDKFCKVTYEENFKSKNHVWIDNIKEIDEKKIEDFDILCAGFPCQAFSLAGKQRGFNDTRGTIFFDIARILKEKNPKYVFMENVKNIKSHDKGRTFDVISATMDELGYYFQDFGINSQFFTPQKRERVYMVGIKKDRISKENFERLVQGIKESYQNKKNVILMESILEKNVPDKYTLSDKLWEFLQKHANKHKEKGNGFGFGLVDGKDVARTLTARYYKDGSEILVKQNGKNPRRLTPRECARLMGFPDSYKIVCSDTQAYKQFGNSVVVPVIEMFARALTEIETGKNI